MLSQDEKPFLDFLAQNPNTKLISGMSDVPTFRFLQPNGPEVAERNTFYIWDARYDLTPYIEKSDEVIWGWTSVQKTSTGRQVYSLSKSNAPVIEYFRSTVHADGALWPGRIWAEMYALDHKSMRFVYKGEEFENWYSSLATWFRKHFKRVKEFGGYFGEEALSWYQSGQPTTSP